MVQEQGWLSATRVLGMSAYTLCLLSCAFRLADFHKKHVRSRWYLLLTGFYGYFLLDMAFDWRWKLHAFFLQSAMAMGVYGQRGLPQFGALCVLLVMLVAACRWILSEKGLQSGRVLMLCSTVTLGSIWCSEWISYHYLDGVYYRMFAGVMVVGYLWLVCCAVFVVGVWLDGEHRSAKA